MGNTPSQEPFEEDRTEDTSEVPAASPFGRVVRATRALAEGLWGVVRRVGASVEAARHGSSDVPGAGRPADEPDGPASDDALPAKPAVDATREPDRSPTRSGGDRDDAPALCATREDGDLSIYHPDRPGASITSDTWERVEP